MEKIFKYNYGIQRVKKLYRAVTKSYYREAMGALLVFDITKRETFQHVFTWFKEFQAIASNNMEHLPILLIGNKSDLEDRMVTEEEANNFAKTNNFNYIETSARHGNDCHKAFQVLFQEIYKVQSQYPSTKPLEIAYIDQFDPKPREGFECPCSN